jgi:hypothetical protein
MDWTEYNKTTIVFNEDFKQMIRNLKQLPEIELLKDNTDLIELGAVQERIRKQIPKQFIKHPRTDYYACMIQLLIDTDSCNTWNDVGLQVENLDRIDRSKENIEDYFGNTSTCMCSMPHVTNNSIYIQTNWKYNLMEGCICINKHIISTEPRENWKKCQSRQKKIIRDYIKRQEEERIQKWKKYTLTLKHYKWEHDQRQIQKMKECRPYCKYCGDFYRSVGDSCRMLSEDELCVWI